VQESMLSANAPPAASHRPTKRPEGVITTVTDESKYVAGLVRLAASLRAHSPGVPLHAWSTNASAAAAALAEALGPTAAAEVTVVQSHDRTTDEDLLRLLRRVPGEEDRVHVREKLRYKLMKVHYTARSPFVRTLFVDADAQLCVDVRPLLATLQRTGDGEVHVAGTGVFHKGAFHTGNPGTTDPVLPITIFANGSDVDDVNSGVLLYSTESPAQEHVFSRWESSLLGIAAKAIGEGTWTLDHREHGKTPIYKDQPPLHDLLRAAVRGSALRFGLLDGRWNQRYSTCIFANGSALVHPFSHSEMKPANDSTNGGARKRQLRQKMDACPQVEPNATPSSDCELVQPFILHRGWWTSKHTEQHGNQ